MYGQKSLKAVKPLCTGVTVNSFPSEGLLTQIEMMAVVGCGGKERLPDWGKLDLRRTNVSSGAPAEESFGYSRIVKVGPFVFCGGTTTVQPDGSVMHEEDANGQTSFILEKLITLMEPLGVNPSDVVKVKSLQHALLQRAYHQRGTEPIMPPF